MTEYKNMTARCLDRESTDEFVLHEVKFDCKEEDEDWTSNVVRLMAKDPISAIDSIRHTS